MNKKELIKAYVKNGRSYASAGKFLGVSRQYIQKCANEYGLKKISKLYDPEDRREY